MRFTLKTYDWEESMTISRRTLMQSSVAAASTLWLGSGAAHAEAAPSGGKTRVADVLVVGGGYSGLAAAVAAARSGAKVLLIEKRRQTGGDGAISGGVFQSYRTVLHDKQGITEKVGPEDYWERFAKGLDDEPLQKVRDNTPNSPIYHGINKHNPEVIKKAALYAPKVMDFVLSYGIEFMPVNPAMPYRIAMASGEPAKFAKAMLDELKAKGVAIRLNTRATDLILEDGRVVGVTVETRRGKKESLYAGSVILATGGWINNRYLLERYKRYWGRLPSFIIGPNENTPKDRTGDGVMMGKKIGAALEDMESMAKFFSRPEASKLPVSWLIFDVEPAYVVSKDAKRVTDENKARYSGICLDLIRAGYDHGYLILGSDTVNGPNNKRFRLDKVIAAKSLFKGDTPEELAAQVGLDPKVLRETIERINKDAAAGTDTEFGRKDPFFKPLKAPYYISAPAYVGIYKTEGGLEVNPDFQVIRATDDQPIPGLYAVGAGCGSITSRHSEVVASGLIAGEHAAKAVK